jgi:ABC-type nitrate/sulfonate/bicarbonate transport system substrate-binding protein
VCLPVLELALSSAIHYDLNGLVADHWQLHLMRKLLAIAVVAVLVCLLVLRLHNRLSGEVRLAYPPIMASLPVFVAENQHLFEKAGVRARNVSFSSSNDMVNALIAGQVDLLPAVSIVPLIHLEIQHPGKIRIFAHSKMRPENSTYRIVVKNDSPVKTLKDLEGKKLGVFPGTSATRMVSSFLSRNQVDPQRITFVPLPPSAQLASLESGAIDALFAYDPLTLTMPERYRAISNSVYAELLDPCPLGVSVVAREFERRRPRTAIRAILAVQEGIAYTGAHPEEVKALLPVFTKMTPEVASRVNVRDVTLSNDIDLASLQAFVNLLYDTGEIPERIDAHRLVDGTH